MTNPNQVLNDITRQVLDKCEEWNEDQCWYYLRETLPGHTDDQLAWYADRIELMCDSTNRLLRSGFENAADCTRPDDDDEDEDEWEPPWEPPTLKELSINDHTSYPTRDQLPTADRTLRALQRYDV